jgi:membrane protein DedA with SNARE-associated domain
MALESACIPIPSEIIMPLSGWMLVKDKGLPVLYTLAAGGYGALGCTIGSAVAYWVGIRGGRPFLEKYGRYVLIHRDDLDAADKWFARYGNWVAFVSRLLPVVRTFISLPAGIAAMNFPRFLVYTFTGSFIWCAALAYGGYLLGEHWDQIRSVMRPFDPVIGILIVALIGYYIYRHVKRFRTAQKSQ